MLKNINDKRKEMKKFRDKAEKVIDDFQSDHINKLKEYIDIYEDYRKGGFEFDDAKDSDHINDQNSRSVELMNSNNQTGLDLDNKKLVDIVNETDLILNLRNRDTNELNQAKTLDFYVQFWEKKQ